MNASRQRPPLDRRNPFGLRRGLAIAVGIWGTLLGTLQAAPNVLFIAVDDLKPTIGAYGDPIAQTPHIDQLAGRGVTFLNAHCQWAVCGPSRASLTTSLMPEETGVMGFKPIRALLPDVITLPQHFRNNGYETAATGKIHDPRTVGEITNPNSATSNGSRTDDVPSWSIPYVRAGGGLSSTKKIRSGDGKEVNLAAESIDLSDASFGDRKILAEGLELLDQLATQFKDTGKPFFLGVGFKKPHLPFLAPKTYWDLYERTAFSPHPFPEHPLNGISRTFNNITELRDNYYLETNAAGQALPLTTGVLPDDQQRLLIHGYYACTSFIDALIGQLISALDDHGLTNETIIVLWGDHGFHLGDHNEWGKHTNLEQATRSPLIIAAPGVGPTAVSTDSPTTFLDLYPTLCDLAGLPLPEQPLSDSQPTGRPLRGKSLRPILEDPAATVRYGAVTHYGSSIFGYAYRTRRYRYVEWIDDSGSITDRELYDYQNDPHETVNLAPDPHYAALAYLLSRSMRNASETAGCERLLASAAAAKPPDPGLPATLRIVSDSSGSPRLLLAWPESAASVIIEHNDDFHPNNWQPYLLTPAGGQAVISPETSPLFLRVRAD